MTQAVLELGELDAPVWLFGGCYSNLQATQAFLAQAKAAGISSQQLICNGDAVAYCAEPQSTVELLRSQRVHWLQGNCEQALAEQAADCGCGFEPGSTCSLLARDWYSYSQRHLDIEHGQWLAGLPTRIRFQLAGLKVEVVHAGLSSNNRFLFASSPPADFEQEWALTEADIVVGGHSGIPFGQQRQGRYWLNSGVIGMPANDGTPDGWYLVLEPETGRLRCRWQRLRYDAELAAQRMQAAGLDGGYDQALLTGIWPSHDILPQQQRQQQGQRLNPAELLIPLPST